jgi:quercetin dioxygenase-like cupin family protein
VTDRNLLGAFDLATEIARFPPGDGASGRRAEILVKTDRLRLVLVTMRAGASLDEHAAPGPISIQALQGRFVVIVGDRELELGGHGLLALAAGVRHAVRAVDGGAFLLTIGGQQAADDASHGVANPRPTGGERG